MRILKQLADIIVTKTKTKACLNTINFQLNNIK